MEDFDYSNPEVHTGAPDKRILIEEHPVGPSDPVSYMAYNNCINTMHEISEIMEMMNLCDDLPQWVDQLLSEGADRFKKAKSYILSEKEAEPEVVVSYDHDDVEGHPTSQTFDYAPQSIGVPMAPTMVTPMNDYDMSGSEYCLPTPKFSSKRYSSNECQQFDKDLTYYADGNNLGVNVTFIYKGTELGNCYVSESSPMVDHESLLNLFKRSGKHVPNLEMCVDYVLNPNSGSKLCEELNSTIQEEMKKEPDYSQDY